MQTRPKRLLLAILLLATVSTGLVQATRLAWFALVPARPGAKETAVIEIHKGQGAGDVAKQLGAMGVINDVRWFIWLGRFSREWRKVKAGEYQVSPGMTPLEVLRIVTSGISLNHPITVREGENMYDVAKDLGGHGLGPQKRFLELLVDAKFIESLGFKPPLPASLEGYLFPETYFFNRSLTPEEMLRQMVKRFLANWTPEFQTRAQALNLSRHQVVILASIVEKETGAAQERPMISSVFHNRLKKRMRLQSDPTTIYGMWDRFEGKIHKEDLSEENPYNTYTIPGLPIGPISNPGKEALHAALFPDQTDFLFFVSHNDGTHEFTRTFEEHTHAVRKFQLDPKAREGKSWRDLKKLQGSADHR